MYVIILIFSYHSLHITSTKKTRLQYVSDHLHAITLQHFNTSTLQHHNTTTLQKGTIPEFQFQLHPRIFPADAEVHLYLGQWRYELTRQYVDVIYQSIDPQCQHRPRRRITTKYRCKRRISTWSQKATLKYYSDISIFLKKNVISLQEKGDSSISEKMLT